MRWVEDAGFVIAALVALVYGLAESAAVLGFCRQTCASHDFPWGLVVIQATLALPKVLGRATAGALWSAIAARFGGKVPSEPS